MTVIDGVATVNELKVITNTILSPAFTLTPTVPENDTTVGVMVVPSVIPSGPDTILNCAEVGSLATNILTLSMEVVVIVWLGM